VETTETALPGTVLVRTSDEAKAIVATIHREHYAALVRTVALLVRDTAEAEDIVQEAHVRLYRSWDRVRDPAAAPGYLRATALNLARSRLRTIIRGRSRSEEPKRSASPDEAAISGETGTLVIRALKALPRRQRECLVLRHYLDLTDREIAADLGISIGAVKQHLFRGLEKLEKELGSYR
jgi:RNA polymerase sigma-70 factor (sigma-E family)